MIVYASRTGNVKFICKQLGCLMQEVTASLKMSQPFVLATYTDGLGDVPPQVQQFMQEHAHTCVGIIVSGNRNFGPLFAQAGERLAAMYNIPIICKIDLRGQKRDYAQIVRFLEEKGLT